MKKIIRKVPYRSRVFTSATILATVLTVAVTQNAWSDLRNNAKLNDHHRGVADSNSMYYLPPAGDLKTYRHINIDGYDAAILPSGRLVTPVGVEVSTEAPKPFGLDLSPDGKTLITVNSGSRPFSVSLIKGLQKASPTVQRIDIDASFMGVTFSADSKRFYVAGGESGNILVGDTEKVRIIGNINLNGKGHPLTAPFDVTKQQQPHYKGSFPGNMSLSKDGQYLYVVDQAAFRVHVIDTRKIEVGEDDLGRVLKPNNFDAVVNSFKVGRYPFGINLSDDGKTLFVAHVGVLQFTHLRPKNPTGEDNVDYPLCFPAVGFPDESEFDHTITIKKVDSRHLPDSLSDPDGIRCGYINADLEYTVPGVGDPNAPEASSVYVVDVSTPTEPKIKKIVKPGTKFGEMEDGIKAMSGSHPNAIAIGQNAIYISNGNNDSVSILHPKTFKEISRIKLSPLTGYDAKLKGTQPVGLALSPDEEYLYVTEAGLNAVAVIKLEGRHGKLLGHIPTGWWPSSVRVSADGKTLYVANARGRGATSYDDFPPFNIGTPKYSVIGSVSIIPVPNRDLLTIQTERVYANNGFVKQQIEQDENHPIPIKVGKASDKIKHVIYINKENASYDLLLGDIAVTRKGVPVIGEGRYSLGFDASPNHHELALQFAFSDNFFLEPSVSSDGHRWLANTYTTEFEETHWPAAYGGRRKDAGTDPEVFIPYPGRLGFTGSSGSPDPNDYNQHGSIYSHLVRHGKSIINFGNGFEFSSVQTPGGTAPTGARERVNVPMEMVVRENTDHLYATYNTHIPDSPLPEDPTRYNRFSRFKQVFESKYVDQETGECNLPNFVDIYYPNDHGGGAFNINPKGPAWSFARYIQDNDAALGKTVELISNSPCWKDTVIFVLEDDTQAGMDHVDGHRSILMVISPWAKKQYLSKKHTSMSSVQKTIYQILGVPPLNQYDAVAADLRDMFTSKPDFTSYKFTDINYVTGATQAWIKMTQNIDFSEPDIDEVKLRTAILKSEGLPRKNPEAEHASGAVN